MLSEKNDTVFSVREVQDGLALRYNKPRWPWMECATATGKNLTPVFIQDASLTFYTMMQKVRMAKNSHQGGP